MSSNMLVYTVEDHTGAITIHLALNKESAIQAHLMHFGLRYLEVYPNVSEGVPLSEIKDRSIICWDVHCALAGATDYRKEAIYGTTIH